MSINVACVSGNLTREPEMRSTPGGMAILDIGVAFNDRRKNQQTGQWEDVPNYINAVIFGNRAEALSTILTKGMHVCVHGKLRWSSWEDKNTGQKRSKIEIIADEIDLMSPRQGGQPQGGYQQRPQMAPQAPQMPQNGPQAPQGYVASVPQQTAPQTAPQQPVYGGYQPSVVPPQQQDLYEDSDIPF